MTNRLFYIKFGAVLMRNETSRVRKGGKGVQALFYNRYLFMLKICTNSER